MLRLMLGGAIALVFLIHPSQQGRVQLGSEDQSIDLPSEVPFGQRLFSSRSQRRKASSSTFSPSSSSFFASSTFPPTHVTDTLDAEREETEEPLQQRSLLTGDPIVVNKSEGACAFDGKVYQSGENIERSHLCHFCFCRNGYIDCYWKNCPPAPEGCIELNYEGVCERSLYLCPIPTKKTTPEITRVVRSARLKRQLSKKGEFYSPQGCEILGVSYRVGELVGVATDPCLECRCALDALYCSPKCCFQPAEPDDVNQQLQRSIGHQPVLSNPLQHLRSEFSRDVVSQ